MSEAQNRPGGDFDVWGRDPTCRVNPLLRRHLRGGVRELSAFHFIGSRAIGQRMESPFSCRRSRRDPGARGKSGHQIMIWSHAVDTKFKTVSHEGARS